MLEELPYLHPMFLYLPHEYLGCKLASEESNYLSHFFQNDESPQSLSMIPLLSLAVPEPDHLQSFHSDFSYLQSNLHHQRMTARHLFNTHCKLA